MKKKTYLKLVCSCLALIAYVIGALSCASTEVATRKTVNDSGNSNRDGAQIEVQQIPTLMNIDHPMDSNYELN